MSHPLEVKLIKVIQVPFRQIMQNKFEDDTFLARWLNGQLSEEELAAFEAEEDFAIYQKIAESTAGLQPPARDKQKGWKALHQQMTAAPQPKKPAPIRKIGVWWKFAVAASLIFLIGYFAFFQKNSLQSYTSSLAAQEAIVLPDGTEVYMNADSEITFDKEAFLENRVSDFRGEAFFKVKKGSQFTVRTKNGDVRVLGTSFNLYSRKNKVDLACYSGKVGLRLGPSKEEILLPGNRVIGRDKKIIQKTTINIDNSEPTWISGQSTFHQTDFVEVIEELERQYDVKIDYPVDITTLPKYNGGFPHQQLELALDVVFSSIGYQYKIRGKQVVVFTQLE